MIFLIFKKTIHVIKGVGRKISRVEGDGKRLKNSKNERKIALLSLFREGGS